MVPRLLRVGGFVRQCYPVVRGTAWTAAAGAAAETAAALAAAA